MAEGGTASDAPAYAESPQRDIGRALCLGFCVQDPRPFRLFEGAGATEALRRVAPRAPRDGAAIRSIMSKLQAERDEKLKERAGFLTGPSGHPIAAGEVDAWTSLEATPT